MYCLTVGNVRVLLFVGKSAFSDIKLETNAVHTDDDYVTVVSDIICKRKNERLTSHIDSTGTTIIDNEHNFASVGAVSVTRKFDLLSGCSRSGYGCQFYICLGGRHHN